MVSQSTSTDRVNKNFSNPFPGLFAYNHQKIQFFPDYHLQKYELLKRVTERPFTALMGGEFSGKTSLVNSEIIPTLLDGFFAHKSDTWNITSLRISNSPLTQLAYALSELILNKHSENELPANLAELILITLKTKKLSIIEVSEQYKLTENSNILIFVDQLENLYDSSEKSEVQLFIECIVEVARQNAYPIHILAATRQSIIPKLAGNHDLLSLINSSQFILKDIDKSVLRTVLETYTDKSEITFKKPFIEYILQYYQSNEFNITRFQHTMMRAVDHAVETGFYPILNKKNVEEVGGLSDSIGKQLEEIYQNSDKHEKSLIRRLFQLLTGLNQEGGLVFERRLATELCDSLEIELHDLSEILERFTSTSCGALSFENSKCVITRLQRLDNPVAHWGVDINERSIIFITRKDVVYNWKRLQEWINEESKAGIKYSEISMRASNKASYLEGDLLQEYISWYIDFKPTKAWSLRYNELFDSAMSFLEESRTRHDRNISVRQEEELSRKRKSARNKFIVGLLLVLSLLLFMYSSNETRKLEKTKREVLEFKRKVEKDRLELHKLSERAESERTLAEKSLAKAYNLQEKNRGDSLIEQSLKVEFETETEKNRELKDDVRFFESKASFTSRMIEYRGVILKSMEDAKKANENLNRVTKQSEVYQIGQDLSAAVKDYLVVRSEAGSSLIRDSIQEDVHETEKYFHQSIIKFLQEYRNKSNLVEIDEPMTIRAKADYNQDESEKVFVISSHLNSGYLYSAEINNNTFSRFSLLQDEKDIGLDNAIRPSIETFASSNDGKYIVIARKQNSEGKYPLEIRSSTGRILDVLVFPKLIRAIVSFHKSGFLLVDRDGLIERLDLDQNGKFDTKTILNASSNICDVDYSKDDQILALIDFDRRVLLYDLSTIENPSLRLKKELLSAEDSPVKIQILSKYKALVVGDENGNLWFYHSISGKLIYLSKENGGLITSLSLNKEKSVLSTGHIDRKINIWHLDKFLNPQGGLLEDVEIGSSMTIHNNLAIRDLFIMDENWILVTSSYKGYKYGETGQLQLIPLNFETASDELLRVLE